MGRQEDPAAAPFALADDLGLILSRLGTVTRLRLADALAPMGLTMRQYAVLRALEANQGLSQAALGERLQIDASSIVLVLDDCQKAGWTERRPDPSDRRRYALHLTPAGRRATLRARDAASRAQEQLFAPLSPEQRSELSELLTLLATSGPMVASAAAKNAARAASGR
ncbi:MAG: MarR family transcriptional regulator [Actinomycetota bacterium]